MSIDYDKDLDELDRIWPLGKQLVVPDGGTVLVAGAYEGRYMDYVATRLKPGRVLGFEPQVEKWSVARGRLSRHGDLAKVICIGIGVHDCEVTLDDCGSDGCHVSTTGGNRADLQAIETIVSDLKTVDLFICNMEGYEIPLLGYLFASGLINLFKSIAVQFHSNDKHCYQLMTDHYGAPVYDDFPTWVYWIDRP